jgi:hypothetical protein
VSIHKNRPFFPCVLEGAEVVILYVFFLLSLSLSLSLFSKVRALVFPVRLRVDVVFHRVWCCGWTVFFGHLRHLHYADLEWVLLPKNRNA